LGWPKYCSEILHLCDVPRARKRYDLGMNTLSTHNTIWTTLRVMLGLVKTANAAPVPHWSMSRALLTSADDGERRLFAQAVLSGSNLEMDWLWLAATLRSRGMREYALQRALYINPESVAAREGLRRLDQEGDQGARRRNHDLPHKYAPSSSYPAQ
jgi:hypothetical protein